jgi:hypothetical protein
MGYKYENCNLEIVWYIPVISVEAGIQTPSLRKQGTKGIDFCFHRKPWIPPYQVRGRLSQARNDRLR